MDSLLYIAVKALQFSGVPGTSVQKDRVCYVSIFIYVYFQQHILYHLIIVFKYNEYFLRFEVFTAVAMMNGVFWDVTPCGSCKNRRFGGT
jgi:hypothetical protein